MAFMGKFETYERRELITDTIIKFIADYATTSGCIGTGILEEEDLKDYYDEPSGTLLTILGVSVNVFAPKKPEDEGRLICAVHGLSPWDFQKVLDGVKERIEGRGGYEVFEDN